ncbi:MAG: hypothetical protein HY646_06575 [Acidobacteria bacterium]|nr:hypothetical protein [Acidobacteriota bacterium]
MSAGLRVKFGPLVVWTLLVTASPIFAQSSQYVIPKFNSRPQSQLVLSNLSAATVNAEITFYGSTFARHFFTILPNTQARVTAGNFGLTNFSGSVVVSTPTPISVVASIDDEVGGGFETIGPTRGSSNVIIPFGPGTFGSEEITIFNPDAGTANVVLAAISPNGTTLSGALRNIEGFSTHRESLDSLFPPNPFSSTQRDISHIVIRSANNILGPERRLHAVGTLRNYAAIEDGLAVLRSDPALIPAVPVADAALTAHIPYFVSGGGYETLLQVVNTRDFAGTVTVTIVDMAGVPLAVPVTLQLRANGSIRENLRNLFNLQEMVLGSIRIDASLQVIASAGMGNSDVGSFAVIPSAPPTDINFVFSVRAVNREFFTGFAILNLNAFPVSVNLLLMKDDGTAVSRVQQTVQPFSMLTRTVSEFFPEATDSGLIHISADGPIRATALDGRVNGTMLSVLAAMHSQPDFRPPDVTSFLAAGTVRHNAAVLSAVGIQLSGPVTQSAVTDSAGTFSFRNLAQGTYRLRPQLQGYTFEPTEITFTISDDNSRNNDFAATLIQPVISAINPANVVAGAVTTNLSLQVQGGPFISSSKIVFEGTALPSTLGTATITAGGTGGVTAGVGSTTGATITVTAGAPSTTVQTLTASIPASSLVVARLASVAVQTTGPGGDVTSVPATLTIGNPSPVISSFAGIPTPLIAGNPGFTLTLNGTGFMQGVRVLVNGVARPATLVNSTQITANILAEDLFNGGTVTIVAANPDPTVAPSTTLNLAVTSPPAGITSISPTSVEARLEVNAPSVPVTVTGFGFKPLSTVQIDAIPVLTQYVSSTVLIGNIPQEQLIEGRNATITVMNPIPSLPSEGTGLQILNLPPVLNSLETPPLFHDATRPVEETYQAVITLRGQNLSPVSIYEFATPCAGAAEPGAGSAVWATPQTAYMTVPIACAGTYFIRVRTLQPGGGVSTILSFDVAVLVNPTAPTITSLSPSSIAAGSATFTLTISGSGFQAGGFVNFGSYVLTPTSVTANSVTVVVPAFAVRERGSVPVIVTNASATGSSNRLLFTVN